MASEESQREMIAQAFVESNLIEVDRELEEAVEQLDGLQAHIEYLEEKKSQLERNMAARFLGISYEDIKKFPTYFIQAALTAKAEMNS